ncbi:unnamed protein product, partial [Oppiella nova]
MGFWKRKSGLVKKLIVSVVVFVLISIGLLVATIVLTIKYIQTDDEPDVCESAECLIAASNLQSSLNLSADPCEDFYEYSCGGWIRDNIIPPDRGMLARSDVTRKRLKNNLRVLLDAEYDDKYPTIISDATKYYKQCMDLDKCAERKREKGLRELKDLVNDWPMINNSQEIPNFLWWKEVARLIRGHKFNFILSNYVAFDSKNTSIYSIHVDAPSLGVGRIQLVKPDDQNNKRILEAYKVLIEESAQLLDGGAGKLSANIKADIQHVVDFESDLAKIMAEPSARRNRTELYGHKIDLQTFVNTYNIPLLDIERQVFTNYATIDGNTGLIVYDRDYFRQLADLLNRTHTKDVKIIQNYLKWRTVRSLGTHTSKAFRDIEFAFNKVLTGVEEPPALWEVCVNLVNNRLPFAVGRLYVDKHFPEEAKRDMDVLIDALNKAFTELLDENEWMEKETKDKVREKLATMLRFIGYPDFIKKNSELTDYYSELVLNFNKSFLETIKDNNLWTSKKWLTMLNKSNQDRSTIEWFRSPAIVDAFFSPHNIIRNDNIPGWSTSVSILYVQTTNVSMGIKFRWNRNGAQYDRFGNLYNWRDGVTQQRFNERIKCFINQYNGYNDSNAGMNINGKTTIGENIADNGGLRQAFKINGKTTIGENIADNGGLRQAFKALENYSVRKQSLPGSMKSFTSEQLFFLSFANVRLNWIHNTGGCVNIRDKALKRQIETDPHSPNKYRIWGTVSNSESFAKAFNCKPKTNMNPEPKDKCILW